MLDLAAHGQHEKDDPVNNQNGPEDGDVKHGEPAAEETDHNGASGGVPEFELRQSSDERSEFLVPLGGKARGAGIAVFETFILGQGGVEFGSQEGEEKVKEVNSKSIGNNVPSLREDNAQEEDEEKHAGTDPAICCVGS